MIQVSEIMFSQPAQLPRRERKFLKKKTGTHTANNKAAIILQNAVCWLLVPAFQAGLFNSINHDCSASNRLLCLT